MTKKYSSYGKREDHLMEEMGELLQVLGKAKRFGPESFHPDDPDKTTNKVLIGKEMEDVLKRLKEFAIDWNIPLTQTEMIYQCPYCRNFSTIGNDESQWVHENGKVYHKCSMNLNEKVEANLKFVI